MSLVTHRPRTQPGVFLSCSACPKDYLVQSPWQHYCSPFGSFSHCSQPRHDAQHSKARSSPHTPQRTAASLSPEKSAARSTAAVARLLRKPPVAAIAASLPELLPAAAEGLSIAFTEL